MPTDRQIPAVADRPVTRSAAEEIGAFRLAEQWADRLWWPWPGDQTARDELAELAHMSALAAWLRALAADPHSRRAPRGRPDRGRLGGTRRRPR